MLKKHEPLTRNFIDKHGGKFRKYKQQHSIYAQGDSAHDLFYILTGKVLVSIATEDGKVALIAVLGPEQFFGEDCIDAEGLRNSTVTAATDCEVAAFRANGVLHALREDPNFTAHFAAFLMERNKQLKASLVDQMLLSGEKRLARLLLKLVPSEKEVESHLVDIPINQDMIARMIGTTRSRVNEFMNKFRKLGYIEYDGQLKVHNSLNSVLTD